MHTLDTDEIEQAFYHFKRADPSYSFLGDNVEHINEHLSSTCRYGEYGKNHSNCAGLVYYLLFKGKLNKLIDMRRYIKSAPDIAKLYINSANLSFLQETLLSSLFGSIEMYLETRITPLDIKKMCEDARDKEIYQLRTLRPPLDEDCDYLILKEWEDYYSIELFFIGDGVYKYITIRNAYGPLCSNKIIIERRRKRKVDTENNGEKKPLKEIILNCIDLQLLDSLFYWDEFTVAVFNQPITVESQITKPEETLAYIDQNNIQDSNKWKAKRKSEKKSIESVTIPTYIREFLKKLVSNSLDIAILEILQHVSYYNFTYYTVKNKINTTTKLFNLKSCPIISSVTNSDSDLIKAISNSATVSRIYRDLYRASRFFMEFYQFLNQHKEDNNVSTIIEEIIQNENEIIRNENRSISIRNRNNYTTFENEFAFVFTSMFFGIGFIFLADRLFSENAFTAVIKTTLNLTFSFLFLWFLSRKLILPVIWDRQMLAFSNPKLKKIATPQTSVALAKDSFFSLNKLRPAESNTDDGSKNYPRGFSLLKVAGP